MHVQGDELGRTQNGNNNPYQVDSVATWNNYAMIATDAPQRVPTGAGGEPYHDNLGQDAHPDGRNDLFLFVRYLLQLRKAHSARRQADYAMPITFSRADGSPGFDGFSDLQGRVLLQGSAVGDGDFLLLTNMHWQAAAFAVPAPSAGKQWVRLVDTAAWAEPGSNAWPPETAAVIGGSYTVNARSMVLLTVR
jgi:glycogen operon protein